MSKSADGLLNVEGKKKMATSDPIIIHILLSFVLAEIVWRLGRAIKECICFPNNYTAHKYLTIFQYSFTFSIPSAILLICIAIYAATQYKDMPDVIAGIWKQKIIVIIILLFRIVSFDRSTLYYSDLIRSDSGLDYATGMASNYFHGYLKLTLPSVDEQRGIRDRIMDYEDKHQVRFAVKRLFILIPSSLHTSPVIKSQIMERQNNQPLEGVKKDRAGVSRPYTNDVYRILIDGEFYYISVEGATPLLSYLESLSYDITSTWQMKAMQREITLKFYFYLKKILSKYHETVKQVELVYYDDKSPEGKLQDVGEMLAAYIKHVWEEDEIESLNRY